MVLSKDLKFSICFGLIIGTLFSFFSFCFAAESESISYDGIINNALINNQSITHSANYSLYYVELEPGYTYTVTANSLTIIAFGNGLDFGDETSSTTTLTNNNSITFSYSDMKYAYFFSSADNSTMQFRVSITREPLEGMNGVIDNLAYTLSFSNIWGVVGFVVPILGIAILLALGFYLVKRLINRIKRKKGGV